MDQHERIEQLKQEVRRLAGGDDQSFGIDNLPPDLAEEFLQRVIAFETAPMVTDFAQLLADGVELPDPDTVADGEVGAILWRVIVALSRHRVFLERTNHLNDRELYSVLWHNVLREEHAALPGGIPGGWHVDIPGDDGDATSYLTYYATERDREMWRKDFPDARMPPHREPAYDRDARLPVPED